MPLGRLVEGVYGGKAGVWFRKKSRSGARRGIRTCMPTTTDLPRPAILQGNPRSDTKQCNHHDKDQYSFTAASPTTEKDNSSDDDDDDDIETDRGWFGRFNSSKKPPVGEGASHKRKRAAVLPLPDMVQRKKRRVSSRNSTNQHSRTTRVSSSSPVDQRLLFHPSPLAPTPVSKRSICDALNSGTKGTPMVPVPTRQPYTPVVTVVSTDTSVSARNRKLPPDTKPVRIVQKKKPAIPHTDSSLSLSLLLPVKTTTTPCEPLHDQTSQDGLCQPSFQTKVDAARAFFERLDKTQPLTLDSSFSSSLLLSDTPRNPSVRTKRTLRMHHHNPELQDEYDTYVDASEAAGVKPLSLQDYAQNRAAYFRTNGMYDGFLDDG